MAQSVVWAVVLIGGAVLLLARPQAAALVQGATASLASLTAPVAPRPVAADTAAHQPQVVPSVVPTFAVDVAVLSQGPLAVAIRFDTALNEGDVEGCLALFAPDAQVKVPPDLYNGATQIRTWLAYLAANHFAAEPGARHLAGNTVSWSAQARSDQLARLGVPVVNGEATLEVHGAQITAYTFVLDRQSASQLRQAQLTASEVLQDPIIVGAESANVYGPGDVFRAPDGRLVSYRDVLSAEPGAGPYYDLGGQPITILTGI
jgi:hypothetical protein